MIRLDGSSPGARLRAMRLARGWTQAQLAQQLGWRVSSGSLIARFESNGRQPTQAIQATVVRLLGADPWTLPSRTLTDAQFERLLAVLGSQGSAEAVA